jgi:peptidyl-tRNA hydrolase, PTH1 family
MSHYLFIGLGNPGPKYEKTRHNLGISLLRAWAEHVRLKADASKAWRQVAKFQADVAELQFGSSQVTCFFPLTSMNRSGQAVRQFLRRRLGNWWRPPAANQLLIIHDDLEVPLGEFRFRQSGSARGHNGVRSIHTALGTTDIPRFLLGIGPKPKSGTSDFVLGTFTPSEEETLDGMLPRAIESLTECTKNRSDRKWSRTSGTSDLEHYVSPPHNPTDE